ncbi:MAG: uroporphyrinogen decarboxylase family protein [Phycisphaeraceae bacterium]
MTQALASSSTVTPGTLTPRQRFIAALERRPLPGRVPHFELVFFLTMQAFGRVHPSHRAYSQWDQMSDHEKQLHRADMADLYIATAERYEHGAIFIHPNPNTLEETQRLIDLIRDRTGDRYFLMMHGDPTFSIPDGTRMVEFSYRMADEPDKLKAEAQKRVDDQLVHDAKLKDLDGFALCADYCFNSGPFLSPDQFDQFITPYLIQAVAGQRQLGYYVIKHTDGNIMPILDRLLAAQPHALHSLDPQGGVDMAEMVRLAGDQVALCGNVHCGLMQTGTDEQVIASARYALEQGMKAPGYIFATSNCIYTGMTLERYELILDVWRKHGERPPFSG